ncbi:MAG: hypothetical protein ACYSYL_19840 [Planctomycetota bacterium]|jgi:hypothetical protein
MGLTNKKVGQLAPLSRSWLQPAELKVKDRAFNSKGYNRNQRAYILSRDPAHLPQTLELELAASEDSPIVNPVFVIEGWGENDISLNLNGKEIRPGRNFRYGHRHTLEGSDLIVWINIESAKPVRISINPVID